MVTDVTQRGTRDYTDRAEMVSALERMNVLSSATQEELVALAASAVRRDIPTHEIVYSADESDGMVYFLDEGKVRLCKVTEDGREVTLAVLSEGEIFGELGSIEDASCDTFAEALEETRVYCIPRAEFEAFCMKSPRVALSVIAELADRLRRRESQIEDLVFRSVSERVASTLLRLAADHGRVSRRGITIDLRLTHKDIANMVASTRETVTGVLSGLRKLGAIEMDHKRVLISDGDILRNQAGLN
jgi:CRP/FNR family cyclic AMP-dependent transcriptional regulator